MKLDPLAIYELIIEQSIFRPGDRMIHKASEGENNEYHFFYRLNPDGTEDCTGLEVHEEELIEFFNPEPVGYISVTQAVRDFIAKKFPTVHLARVEVWDTRGASRYDSKMVKQHWFATHKN